VNQKFGIYTAHIHPTSSADVNMHSVEEFLSKQSILGPNKAVELVFSEKSKILGWMREMDINFH